MILNRRKVFCIIFRAYWQYSGSPNQVAVVPSLLCYSVARNLSISVETDVRTERL